MTRVAALAAALAAALVAGSAAPAKVEGRLFGLVGTQSAQFVVEVDPATLQALPGRRLKLGAPELGGPWTLDPSRHTLAIVRWNRLRFIDLPSLRPAGSVKLDSLLEASGVVWLRPDRIVVLRRGVERYQVLVVDVALRRIVSRRELAGGLVVDAERTQSELVLLRAPTGAIGPASLLVVDGGGDTREIALPRILAGLHVDRDLDPPVATANEPGLALDKERRVAYVAAADGLVAEVPLDGADVRYHAVHGRFAKLVSGSWRHALVVDGQIFVTGNNGAVWTLPNGKPAMRLDPVGLEMIDPATWQARRLADVVESVAPWAGGLLATGGSWSSVAGHEYGMGLAAYAPDGTERFRVLDGKRIWISAVYGGKAFVHADNEEPMRIIDLETGNELGTRRDNLPWLLLEQNAPVW